MEVIKNAYSLINDFFRKEYGKPFELLIDDFNAKGFKSFLIDVGFGFFGIHSSRTEYHEFVVTFNTYRTQGDFDFQLWKEFPMTIDGFEEASKFIDRKRIKMIKRLKQIILIGKVDDFNTKEE